MADSGKPTNEISLLLKNSLQKYQSGQEIEIDVEDEPSLHISKPKPPSSIDIFLNRYRYKHQQNYVNLQEPTPAPKNANKSVFGPRLGTAPVKAGTPIVSHQKERERKGGVPIDVDGPSQKNGLNAYKNTLFQQTGMKKPAIADRTRSTQEAAMAQAQKQKERKKRMEEQMRIMDEMSSKKPWQIEKDKCRERNQERYPISSHTEYGFREEIPSKKVSSAQWMIYEKDREETRKRRKEKERREKEEQKKRQMIEEEKKKERHVEECSRLFGDILGIQPTKKVKPDQPQEESFMNQDDSMMVDETPLKNIEVIQQFSSDSESQEVEQRGPLKQHRTGAKDHIKPHQTQAPNFIRTILKHDFSKQLDLGENKRIPNSFQQAETYTKVFHYLLTNECIADIAQRLKGIENDSNDEPLKVKIGRVRQNGQGLVEIDLEEEKTDEVYRVNNLSLSKYRLGLLVSDSNYTNSLYGCPSNKGNSFGFVVQLVTPQKKKDLGPVTKVVAAVKIADLQMCIRKRKKSTVYFYDLQKLSTHIRQYLAISNLPYSSLSASVYQPQRLQKQFSHFVDDKELLSDMLNCLRELFNPTQWQSIKDMVFRKEGFVLLQGPPGTGKTSTLMGLLSAQYEYLKKTGDQRKIMICAPSNAAVNHITKRIKTEGLISGQGEIIHPSILRTGIVETSDPDVRSVSLDEICEANLNALMKESTMTTPQIKAKIIELQKTKRRLDPHKSSSEFLAVTLELKRMEAMLYEFRREKMVLSRQNYTRLEKLELDKAEIILTTLSSSGTDKLDQIRGEFACLIVDEAAQATEPNLLIALQTGVEKVLLIGDPYQLPATCLSTDCNVTLFNRSLFERFLDADIKPYFLNIQYRMAPLIRSFPSRRFYCDRLCDSENVLSRPVPPFLQCFNNRNVLFIDVKYGRQETLRNSKMNSAQGRMVSLLIRCLLQKDISLGVITPYQSQRRIITRECEDQLGQTINAKEQLQIFRNNIMINTVDSFQGQQRDIIIVSTVRANDYGEMGFLTDERRINVTLTRSKFLLVVVGNGDTLGSNEVWDDFLTWTEENGLYYTLEHKQLSHPLLKDIFGQIRPGRVRRRRYNKLSTDQRKAERSMMQLKHFKKLARGSSKEDTARKGKRPTPSRQDPSSSFLSQNDPHSTFKHALSMLESQNIIQQKKKKEEEADAFQEMNKRMKEAENRLFNDDEYRDLFS